MTPIASHPLLGVLLHGVGAFFAATCYTPQKQVKRWSWQTYWLTQAAFCWFLLPLLGALLTIPDLLAVLREAPRSAMGNSFLLGAAYGIGGTAFGISIRYIGFSLTYAIAVGLSSVLGTLIPPLVKGTLGDTLNKPGAGWIVAGIVVGTLGISGAGVAGRLKELDLTANQTQGEFSLMKGLALSLLAGVLSAVYGFALEAGEPIADVASAHGAGVWRGNVVYIFSNTGAFLTTAIYCLWLHARHKTLGELVRLPAGSEEGRVSIERAAAHNQGLPMNRRAAVSAATRAEPTRAENTSRPSHPGSLLRLRQPRAGSSWFRGAVMEPWRLSLNWAMAMVTGLFWYGQFFFYNLGHVRMGTYKFTSWAIHMILLVLFSNVVGLGLREWRQCRRLTHSTLALALLVLVGAVLLLTYGNHLGDLAAK